MCFFCVPNVWNHLSLTAFYSWIVYVYNNFHPTYSTVLFPYPSSYNLPFVLLIEISYQRYSHCIQSSIYFPLGHFNYFISLIFWLLYDFLILTICLRGPNWYPNLANQNLPFMLTFSAKYSSYLFNLYILDIFFPILFSFFCISIFLNFMNPWERSYLLSSMINHVFESCRLL